MVRKPSKEVYVSKELKELLDSLNPEHKLKKWIENMKIRLKGHMLKGNKIKKKQIPSYYIEHYGVTNLFLYKHPEGYRSCYTLHNFEVGVCPVILDIMSHPEYDRIFGYKKR